MSAYNDWLRQMQEIQQKNAAAQAVVPVSPQLPPVPTSLFDPNQYSKFGNMMARGGGFGPYMNQEIQNQVTTPADLEAYNQARLASRNKGLGQMMYALSDAFAGRDIGKGVMERQALQAPEYKIQQLQDGNYYYVDPTGSRPPTPVSTNITPERDEKIITDLENQLRDEHTDGSGEYLKVRDAYARVDAAGKDPSAAGDLALIFNYMKMLDPGSTVREGEFANAQNSAGVPERIRAQFNQVQSGQRLADTQRKDFLDRADMLYRAALRGQKQLDKTYTGLAERNKVNIDNVVIDYASSVSDIAFANQIKNMALSELQNYDKSNLSEKQKNILDEIITMKMAPSSNANLAPNADIDALLQKY